MARKKTADELAADIKALEARLAKAKEQQRRLSKAEEAAINASIINVVRDEWNALPTEERPKWEQMPEYIRKLFAIKGVTRSVPGQSE